MTLQTRRAAARRPTATALAFATALALAAPWASTTAHAAEDPWTRAALVADDEFSRTTTSGLGSAPTGGAYTVNNVATYKVGSGRATIGPVDATRATTAVLPAATAADVEVAAELVLPTVRTSDFSTYQGVQLRRGADGSAYRARLVVNSTGRAFVNVERVNGAAATPLAHVSLPAAVAAGSTMVLDARVTGTNPVVVEARASVKGQPVPAWQARVSDTAAQRIATSGAVGTWVYNDAGAAHTVQVDRLTAWRLAPATATTAPVAAPAPAPAPTTTTTTAGRGAPSVGTTAYPVPTGAVLVDAARGSDANPGTAQAPKKTIQAGVNTAVNGRTVVVRAGVYHEQVTIPYGKSITVQNYPNEAVWLDGSRSVTGWRSSGSTWVVDNWTAEFDDSASYTKGQDHPTMLRPEYPAAAKPDQVFVDGKQLRQVLSASQVVAGTFAVDYAANRLIIGTDPTGRQVRATDLANGIDIAGDKNVVQGIGVRRYATSMPRIGTVRVWGASNTVRDLVVEDAATVGISFVKANNLAERVTVVRAGLLGIHGNQADGLRIRNSVVKENNSERFRPAPTAGGIKVTRTRGVTIDNVLADANLSTGIWTDESVYNMKIVNNVVTNNVGGPGMKLELSDLGIVANNRITGHGDGLLIYNTGNMRIFNNEFGNNKEIAIKLWQDARRQATHSVGRDPRQPVPDPTVPWITRNITVSNNVIDASGRYQVYAADIATNISADNMNITVNGNLLTPRPVSAVYSALNMVGWGAGDNKTIVRYGTPESLAAAKNPRWRNASNTGGLAFAELLKIAPSLAGVAVPLPTDVAATVGVASGTAALGVIRK